MTEGYSKELAKQKEIAQARELTQAQKWLETANPNNKRVQHLHRMASELFDWRRQHGYWNIGLPVIIAFARSLNPSQWETVKRCFPKLQETQSFTDLVHRCKIPDNWIYFYNALDPSWKASCIAGK